MTIIEFLNSTPVQLGMTVFNWLMLYVMYRLGQRGERIRSGYRFMVQDAYVQALEEKLQIATTHVDNLQARLEEAQAK